MKVLLESQSRLHAAAADDDAWAYQNYEMVGGGKGRWYMAQCRDAVQAVLYQAALSLFPR